MRATCCPLADASFERLPLVVASWHHLRRGRSSGVNDGGKLARWTACGRAARPRGQRTKSAQTLQSAQESATPAGSPSAPPSGSSVRLRHTHRARRSVLNSIAERPIDTFETKKLARESPLLVTHSRTPNGTREPRTPASLSRQLSTPSAERLFCSKNQHHSFSPQRFFNLRRPEHDTSAR